MSPSEEADLFARMRNGDTNARDTLLEPACGSCVARAANRLPPRRRHEAEDLVQTAFTRAVGEIASFHDATFTAWCRWLNAFVDNARRDRNKYHRRARRDKRRVVSESPNDGSGPGQLEAAAPDSETPSRVVRRAERDDYLQRLRAERLSPQENEVLRWRFDEALSVEETAKRMNRSVGSVKMLCSRAYEKLREALPDPSQLEMSS